MVGAAFFLTELFPTNLRDFLHSLGFPTCGNGIIQIQLVFIENHLADSREMRYDSAMWVYRTAA